MQTYGISYMQSGPVLDVAGGRGELSFEMNNCQGVRTILVEPRPTALNQWEKKWKMGAWQPCKTGPVFSKWNPNVVDGDKEKQPLHPEHLRIFFFAEKVLKFLDESEES
jgi:hypothetical protein